MGWLLLQVVAGRQSEFHVHVAVGAWAVANMDPAAAFLVDALVHRQLEAFDERQ